MVESRTANEKTQAVRECGVDELLSLYDERREVIRDRLREFREVGRESDERIFAELCFCLLTPQTKAKVCDKAIGSLTGVGHLLNGDPSDILPHLKGVRFSRNKASYIVAAREQFSRNGRLDMHGWLAEFDDPIEAREWLVKNVTGLGYKEAGHFLRNIGLGEQLAILDRHILRNLQSHGVLEEPPRSLSKRQYLRIEHLMREFSDCIGIPLADLDLLFWSKETGEVFK